MRQKGSALLISLLISSLIIIGASLYFYTGSLSPKQNTSVYIQDIDQAKEAQIQANFKAIQTALEAFKLNNDHYPSSLNELVSASLLPSLPKNPYTNLDYSFQNSGNTYTLSTKLGNGQDYQITN